MFGARNFFLTAARAVGDSLWNYVTALFSTTSTNGAQNNTFLDSSTNNFTITRNGNTTQGSFSPYEPTGYWSNYFDGSGDYLTLTGSSIGSNNYTVEAWIFPDVLTTFAIFSLGTSDTTGNMVFWVNSNGSINLYGDNADRVTSATNRIVVGQWQHVALVRNSGTTTIYVNGSSVASSSSAYTSTNTTYQVCAGYGGLNTPITGYVSNLRVVNGTAVYTSNFTPSTTPLSAIANTALLTCQSNRFVDNSGSNRAITSVGNVSVQAFSPLGNTTPYSTAAVGGSGYFDGSGDFLQVADAAAMELGSGNWTIELWVNTLTNTQYSALWTRDDGSITAGSYALLLNTTSANGIVTFWAADINGFAAFILSSGSVSCRDGAWHHIAVVRNSNTLTMYIDGVSTSTASYSGAFANTAQPIKIGAETGYARDYAGYMAGVRLVVGTAVYTSNFTPPTAPVAAITNTQLLLNFTNAGVFDSAAVNDFETAGNAQVSTTQTKFGPTSMYFDGNGDYLLLQNTLGLQFGSNNFTIEFWLNLVARDTSGACVFANYNSFTTGALSFFAGHASASATKYQVACNGTFPAIQSSISVTYNQWDHFAIVRSGNTLTLYINGVADGTFNMTGISVNGVGSSWIIGAALDALTSYELNGYIDDLRITKGYARYWYNFPVPTSAFPVQYAPEVIPPSDPLFDYVTMLLPGNGTNGAQNNTFLDSSANNYTITRNGNSTQGAFTPYGPNWSNYLDGDGDNLTLADNEAFEFGSGSFSIDIWINPFAMKGYQGILGKTDSGGDQRGWILYFETNNQIYFNYGNGSWVLGNNSFGTVPVNNWTHLAVTRDTSNVWRLFKNGILVNSTTNSGTINDSNSLLYIGKWPFFPGYSNTQDFGGYMSNARIVKGGMPTLFNTAVTAIGTQVFTPPTAPYTGAEALTAGSVSLLTCQSNRFIDNSSNAFAITVNGTPGTQRFSPFNPPAAYSAATNGGSGYFDGSGDKVLVATNSNMTLGTNDFTVEFWAYPLSLSGERCFTTQSDPTFDQNGYWIGSNGSSLYWLVGNGSSWVFVRTVGTLTLNAWNHIALTRSGTTFRAFINGVLVDTQTSSVSLTNANNNVSIGGRDAGAVQYSNSYISGYRVLNGTCLYTATFTPPTTPPTVITNTQLLTNFTNAGVIDNAMINDLETVGAAQISTAQSKFGGGSILLNGTNSGLAFPPTDLGSGDFTVEWWANQNANFSYFNGDGVYAGEILAGNTTGALGIIMYSGSAGVATNIWLYIYGVVTIFQPAISISLNQWNHFALTRANGTWRLFVNGNQVATSTSNGTYNVVGQKTIGWRNAGGFFNWFPGYIDDFRITRGIARYVQNFTPPTQAFQTQ